MSDLRVIRFEPDGPRETGLENWGALHPASLVAGNPVERGHIGLAEIEVPNPGNYLGRL